jgi:hypothetical protein
MDMLRTKRYRLSLLELVKRRAKFLLAVCLISSSVLAVDFNVTTPNDQFAYNINGMNGNPAITLVRGNTYTFAIDTSFDHPFAIGVSLGDVAPPGVTGANGASSGTITYQVPLDAPDCVYYCVVHDFSGDIHMIDPAKSPLVNIVSLGIGTNIVLTTTQATTNGFAFIPEASTNLATTNWFNLTVRSNRFANGTNEIFCGRPPGTNAFFRIRIE